MDSVHKDTEVKYTESPKYQCLEFLRKNSVDGRCKKPPYGLRLPLRP